MRRPRARKILKRAALTLLAGFALIVLTAAAFAAHCRTVRASFHPTTVSANPAAAGIAEYSRPEDDTFLTYPEWYIVWSYQEKADFQESHLPHGFPFFRAIAQYWSGYCCVYGIVRGRYPFNWGDHLMLVVIGTSFTVEYALKGMYENTIGAISEYVSGGQAVEEDRYASRVAREYADFVHIRPFYEFRFFRSLRGLWRETKLWGAHPLRKWERKAWLSLDYAVEGVYCGLITFATHAVYGAEPATTYAWIENAPEAIFGKYPKIRKVKETGHATFIVEMPRYQEFTGEAISLVNENVRFMEIAGNRQVLVTALAPGDWNGTISSSELLFTAEILTNPRQKRLALRTPVSSLHTLLEGLTRSGMPIEHIYDY